MDRFQVIVLVILVGVQVVRSIRDRMKKPQEEVRPDIGREPQAQEKVPEEMSVASPVANDWKRAVAVREITELVAQRAHQPNGPTPTVSSPAPARRAQGNDLVRASIMGKVILDRAPGWRWFRR
jgi:hypothetical protein